MDPPSTFTALPMELIVKVFSDPTLELPDLASLRLTCKHAYPFATELLAKHSFSKLPIMMTDYSLQAFIGICKNPELGRWVRKVQLSSLRINAAYLHTYIEDRTLHPPRTSPENTIKACNDLRDCVSRYHDEVTLTHSGKAKQQLRLGFQLLSQYSNSIQISVFDLEERTIGHRKFFSDQGGGIGSEWKLWANDYQTALRMLISTSEGSGCKISQLCLDINRLRGPEMTDIIAKMPNGREKKYFWEGIRAVRFYCRSSKPMKACFHTMQQIVQEATQLESIYYSDNYSRLAFNFVGKSITSHRIRRLHLEHVFAPESTLIQILEQNRGTLTYLIMKYCEIGKGSWSSAIAWIKNNLPRLEYLELKKLSFDQSTKIQRRLVMSGRTEIHSGLDTLLSGNRLP